MIRRMEFLNASGAVVGSATIDEGAAPLHLPHYEGAVGHRAAEETETDALQRKLILVIFDHENRLRALEGKVPVTRAQAIARIRAL